MPSDDETRQRERRRNRCRYRSRSYAASYAAALYAKFYCPAHRPVAAASPRGGPFSTSRGAGSFYTTSRRRGHDWLELPVDRIGDRPGDPDFATRCGHLTAVMRIRQITQLDQHGGNVGRAQNHEIGGPMRLARQNVRRLRAGASRSGQSASTGSSCRAAPGRSGSRRLPNCLRDRSTPAMMSDWFSLRASAGRLLVRPLFRQGIDRGAVRRCGSGLELACREMNRSALCFRGRTARGCRAG